MSIPTCKNDGEDMIYNEYLKDWECPTCGEFKGIQEFTEKYENTA